LIKNSQPFVKKCQKTEVQVGGGVTHSHCTKAVQSFSESVRNMFSFLYEMWVR